MSHSPRLSGEQPSPFALLKTRRFGPLFLTQSLGVFNDNLFRNALVVLLTSQATNWMVFQGESVGSITALVFLAPFLLFSATAGQLADKYDKAKLAQLIKLLEMLIMGVAALGLFWNSLAVLLFALCLLGVCSALFAPVKYALLPQHLGEHELVSGNALVQTGAFIALLSALLVVGMLAGLSEHSGSVAIIGLIAAVAGFSASLGIPAAPAAVPGVVVYLNPCPETARNIRQARQDRRLFLAILGVSWLWLGAALFFADFPGQAMHLVGGEESSAIVLMVMLTFGIGVGSMLCKTLSGPQLEIGLIPFGALGAAFCLLALCFALPETAPPGAPLALTTLLSVPYFWRIMFDLFALGVFCGFYIVPLNVLIQLRSAPQQRARMIAVSSFLNALAMLLGGAVGYLADDLVFPWFLALASLGFFGVAAYGYFEAPHLSLRFLTGLLIHFFYRLDKSGLEHIPETGPAVLVCNHVSFVDSIVIMAAIRRPIRFVMDYRIHRTPVVGFLFRHSRTIPIATAKENLALKETAFAAVAHALKNGELIGLFPEGRITHSGEINHFRYGVGRIVSETPVPVIPMAIRGLWGSFFSRRYGPAMSRPSLLRPFAKIELVVGDPVPPEQGSPENLQEIVTALRGGLV